MKDLVSVIIPVYNVEKYLKDCLDSVIEQTYRYLEIIVIDDGSTDSSSNICDEYAARDSRVNVIHKKNEGLSITRNKGLKVSTGEFIYFLDSDDWLRKEAIYNLLYTIKQSTADFVFFDGRTYNDANQNYNTRQGDTHLNKYSDDIGLKVFESLQNNKELRFPVQLYFYKREFLLENRMSFISGIYYEDMVFTFQAFCNASKVAHCHKELYNRRIRKGSIVRTTPNKEYFKSSVTVYHSIIQIAKEKGIQKLESVDKYTARCAMRPLEIYQKLDKSDKKDCKSDYQLFIKEIREKKGFGSKALVYRTYGRIPWLSYKLFQKLRGDGR